MTLANYLVSKGLKPASFTRAGRGVAASTVTRILDGSRRPTLDVAVKMVRAARGEVSFEELAAVAKNEREAA